MKNEGTCFVVPLHQNWTFTARKNLLLTCITVLYSMLRFLLSVCLIDLLLLLTLWCHTFILLRVKLFARIRSFSGYYMALKPDVGAQISHAALQSPTMKEASSTCTLHFYYNMYGEGMCAAIKITCSCPLRVCLIVCTVTDKPELNVVLKEGPTTTRLWWLSGSHKDLWHRGEVTVGRNPEDFTILFEASRTFTKPGHIAIDDIDFTNCTLPGRL